MQLMCQGRGTCTYGIKKPIQGKIKHISTDAWKEACQRCSRKRGNAVKLPELLVPAVFSTATRFICRFLKKAAPITGLRKACRGRTRDAGRTAALHRAKGACSSCRRHKARPSADVRMTRAWCRDRGWCSTYRLPRGKHPTRQLETYSPPVSQALLRSVISAPPLTYQKIPSSPSGSAGTCGHQQ